MTTPTDKNDDSGDSQPAQPGNNAPDRPPHSLIGLLLKLQRARLKAQQRRDQFRHEQQVKRLENDDYKNKRLHRLACLGIGLVALLLAFLLVMAFFGNARQSATALQILVIGSRILGGAGGIFIVWLFANRLIRR